MFQAVKDADFIAGEHQILKFWEEQQVFDKLRAKNRGAKRWSFLDGPITANNPMGVHHAWGRTYKDAYQRFFAMTGHELRYQNGFDCQGLWVEVEVEKQLGLGTKKAVAEYGIDKFVNECKRRVLKFAARQTEQSQRLGYWMEWDRPDELRKLSEAVGSDEPVEFALPNGETVTDIAHRIVEKLGNPEWGGSYFTFSTNNNETIWTFLKKCFERGKIYQGHDVMPWSGRGGSAYSQMEIAEGRKLTTHKSVFVRFPLRERENEFILVWTTTPWTLTSNTIAAVNPDLDYIKLKAKKDDAVYYFAKENLNYQRLASEFKEGFGRPEWKWPKDVPKLKTLGQIFKEQGGFEEAGTIKGAEMVGWAYEGPFDDLDAQHKPGGWSQDVASGLLPVDDSAPSAVAFHKVIDGGRDSRGNAHVVAGEGTGIVHMAPGCGDIDHKIGVGIGAPVIAPLGEDGKYIEGFGDFTGKEAIAPETAELVFEKLKEKGLLVAVETYPHIYPHCWRTGDELVFRLVDEWFINMDWRDEIKDVTREINWLPESIDGQNREVEWLTNMGDWMVSKKRFWGLALPIWVNEEDSTDFEVMGSLDELKERAVEGWDGFEGNSPHRPWIDGVIIESQKNPGQKMRRIEDVGNPWLDAGIVPFSTMSYNENKEEWKKWYPADLVTECFPGQFRNWFYSMLSLGTMMRYDETDDPVEKRPFKTLLGHRLVADEEGKAMHKSDGTAIWFEEAAEQLGVDTLRWMYLAQNPAVDLKFGRRHPNEPVTLSTPVGDITETKEGFPTCKVTSTPADEIRRQVIIPFWNCYKFFVDYAIADEFDGSAAIIPVADRPEIDRWVLSNLQSLAEVGNREMAAFNAPGFCKAAAQFIDDLSNWYIRRNRRRFWRSKDASDTDKNAAYQTLYEVLLTLCKLLAPCMPFLTDRMYQNLAGVGQAVPDAQRGDNSAKHSLAHPESVHLCDYPQPNADLLDEDLNARMAAAQLMVKLGHQLREQASLRVRQPLAELQFSSADAKQAEALTKLADVIKEELNVKQVTAQSNLDDLVSYTYKPNLKTLGPKYGKLLGVLRTRLPEIGDDVLGPLRRGESLTIDIDGNSVDLTPDDVLVGTEQATGWACADESGLQIALSTELNDDLLKEGMARDLVRHVQQLRKDFDLQITDRITITYSADSHSTSDCVAKWGDYVCGETLADSITESSDVPADTKHVSVGEEKVQICIKKVA
jgi:isoleucyl-tRNA synthetase